MKIAAGVIAGLFALLILFTVFGSFYTVDQGQEAVLLNYGSVSGVEQSGLHFKTPFVQSMAIIDIRQQNRSYDQPFESYSKDQQPANIAVSVNYHVPADKAADLYTQYGSVDAMVSRIIDQRVPAILKNVFGGYDAQSAIQERAKLNNDVFEALQSGISGPVVIDSFQIKDIKFSPDYEAAIAAKQKATVQVQEQQQVLDQEIIKAKITVTQAQAQADSQLAVQINAAKAIQINGEAQAAAIKARGDAEAGVIKAKADALNSNPALIELTKAEKWNGTLPTTMLPNSTLPFFNTTAAPVTP